MVAAPAKAHVLFAVGFVSSAAAAPLSSAVSQLFGCRFSVVNCCCCLAPTRENPPSFRELKLDRSWKENEGFWVFGRLQEKAGMVAALVLLPPCFLSFLLSSPLFLLCSLISVFGCYCVLKICVCVGEMGNFCIKGNGVKFLSLQRKAVNGCWFVQEEGLQRLGDGGGKE